MFCLQTCRKCVWAFPLAALILVFGILLATPASAQLKQDAPATQPDNIDKLLQRRRQLELEQSAMWATIATEAVQDTYISLRPLYRFRLHSTAVGAAEALQTQRLEIVRAFALFIRHVDQNAEQLHETVQRDQSAGYESAQKNVLAAHQQLQRDVLAQPLASDPAEDGKRITGLLAQAKRLRSLATNSSDAFQIQAAADDAGDEPRHRTARGQLQEAVLNSAEIVLAMHQDLTKLASDWGIEGEQRVNRTPSLIARSCAYQRAR